MKYRKFGNIVYLVFFLFFIFILFYHSDILDLPKQTIQPYDKSRVIEFMDKNSNKDFILLDISAFVRLFVNCTSFCILALQDKVIEIIKRFFRSKLNIFFTIIPKTPTLLLAMKISEIINTNIIINFVEELAFFLLLDFD